MVSMLAVEMSSKNGGNFDWCSFQACKKLCSVKVLTEVIYIKIQVFSYILSGYLWSVSRFEAGLWSWQDSMIHI